MHASLSPTVVLSVMEMEQMGNCIYHDMPVSEGDPLFCHHKSHQRLMHHRTLGDSFCHPFAAKSPAQRVSASRPNPLDLGGSRATSIFLPAKQQWDAMGQVWSNSKTLKAAFCCRDTELYKLQGCPILILSYSVPNDTVIN